MKKIHIPQLRIGDFFTPLGPWAGGRPTITRFLDRPGTPLPSIPRLGGEGNQALICVVQRCLAIHTRGRISSERAADRTTTFPLQVLMSLSTFLENYIPVRIHIHTIFMHFSLSRAREKAGYVYTDGICTVQYTEKAGKCVCSYTGLEKGFFYWACKHFPYFRGAELRHVRTTYQVGR